MLHHLKSSSNLQVLQRSIRTHWSCYWPTHSPFFLVPFSLGPMSRLCGCGLYCGSLRLLMDIQATISGSCHTGIFRFAQVLTYTTFITHTTSEITDHSFSSGMLSVALTNHTETMWKGWQSNRKGTKILTTEYFCFQFCTQTFLDIK